MISGSNIPFFCNVGFKSIALDKTHFQPKSIDILHTLTQVHMLWVHTGITAAKSASQYWLTRVSQSVLSSQ